MEITNDVMLLDDEVCSRVAGVYNSLIEIVDISPVSTVRWLEVSRTCNSNVSKSTRVCARSATCRMNKANDVMLVDDKVCS
jgi:hypothetical protein